MDTKDTGQQEQRAAKRDAQLVKVVGQLAATSALSDEARKAVVSALEQAVAERAQASADLLAERMRARDLRAELAKAEAEAARQRAELDRLRAAPVQESAGRKLKLPLTRDGKAISPGAILAGGDGALWEVIGIGGAPYKCIGLGVPGEDGRRVLKPLKPQWLRDTDHDERKPFRDSCDASSWPTLRRMRERCGYGKGHPAAKKEA